jgi:hypothetical protein
MSLVRKHQPPGTSPPMKPSKHHDVLSTVWIHSPDRIIGLVEMYLVASVSWTMLLPDVIGRQFFDFLWCIRGQDSPLLRMIFGNEF